MPFILSLFGEFHEICFDERIYISVHHSIDIGGLVIGAVVLHAAVVKDIRANLASPFDLLFAGFHFCMCLTPFLQF